jgi:hypothetical protein
VTEDAATEPAPKHMGIIWFWEIKEKSAYLITCKIITFLLVVNSMCASSFPPTYSKL